jgi:hypothetical protein
MSDAWIPVVGTLLGGTLGFLASFLIERSRRRYDAAHRFEADRRALYGEFMREARGVEERIRERRTRVGIRAEFPDLIDDLPRMQAERPDLAAIFEVPKNPDYGRIERLADEIELLGARNIEFRAAFFAYSLRELGYEDENADEAAWKKAADRLYDARRDFVRAAKRDLDLPSGVMTKWQERRWRLKMRLGLAPRPKAPPGAGDGGQARTD